MNNSQELAFLIKKRAKEVGKTLKWISQECEISQNFMQSMQKEGYMPRLENLCKLADALDCSVDYLLGRTDTPKPHEISAHIDQAHSSFVQSENTPVVMVAPSSGGQPDDLRQELMQCFDRLSFKDKVEIMRMIAEKAG